MKGITVIESDRLLWVPPFAYDSAAPSLELLPPGPPVVLTVALSRMVGDSSWQPMRTAFSTELEPLLQKAATRAGVAANQIAHCTAALFPGTAGRPEVCLAIVLDRPVSIEVLAESWDAVASGTPDGATIYAGDGEGDTYFVAGGEKGKVGPDAMVDRFAVGSLERILEVAENEGGSIPLPRAMQTLWNQSSAESDLVALITPNFLFADGRELLNAAVPEFEEPAKRWLIPDVGALAVSVAVEESKLYVEMRQIPSGGATPVMLLKRFRESITQWPVWAEDFIVRSVQDPSWRLLATRLPIMLRFVGKYTRSTMEEEAVVASVYLPTDAAAQVALGTVLALNTKPGQALAEAPTKTQTLSVEDMLDRPMSISFVQQSLQFAINGVVDEFSQSLPPGSTMPKVRIIGGDLQLNGITQNQQIRGFEKDNVPLRTVLTELLLGANPDKTATGPKDPKQSLVWVVHPVGKSPAETEILITTREASKDKYELPDEFVE